MERRKFLFASTAIVLNGALLGTSRDSLARHRRRPQPAPGSGPAPTPDPVPAPGSGLDVVAEIKKLRIGSGAFTGGYVLAPQGSLNWYFVNLGLLPIVQYLNASDLDVYIRSYLDFYLSRLESNLSIKDIAFPSGGTTSYQLVLADSDDSYGATFLSLVARYLKASQNWNWWSANESRLKNIATKNMTNMVKSNGLTSVFQAPRNQSNSIGYLMDNCEVYRGLRDFASLLRDRGQATEANFYDGFGNKIASGIGSRLFDTARSGFIPSDGDNQAGSTFYPGATCQVFPQAFGLNEMSSYFDKAWSYLNKTAPSWQDGRYDPYPWAVLGFVASKRGQTGQAQAQMKAIESKFVSDRGLVTINELGFYQRTKSVLAGKPDV